MRQADGKGRPYEKGGKREREKKRLCRVELTDIDIIYRMLKGEKAEGSVSHSKVQNRFENV